MGLLRAVERWTMGCLMDFEGQLLTWCCLNRFSLLISSTQLLPLRRVDTSSRCDRFNILEVRRASGEMEADSLPLELGARPKILLHGRQVPRLLHYYHCLLPRTNSRHLRRLLDGSVPTNWWKGSIDRRLLLPKKVDVLIRSSFPSLWFMHSRYSS